MANEDREYSLLPYLNIPKGKNGLKLSLVTQDTAILEKISFPFLVINESDPFARLIEAKLINSSGNEIRKVFLLVQKDQYLLSVDELRSVNNNVINDAWNKAFSYYAKNKQDRSLVFLPDQLKEGERLIRMCSLFFCKTKQVFFHPPCPKCGLELRQCEDDDLLVDLGLQAYSQSSKRYLTCVNCSQSDHRVLYVYELDQFDPPFLKNRRDFIKDLSSLLKSHNANDRFPCTKCEYQKECYGPNLLALSRIAPFSFYPFYMFMFNSMSINSTDFLSHVSGATFDQIESQLVKRHEIGRLNCLKSVKENSLDNASFVYSQGKRHFLEVLYLKLTFLEKLIKIFVSGNDLFIPHDVKSLISRTWINFDKKDTKGPSYWNFKVECLDISRHLVENKSISKLTSADRFFLLGLVWFYTLIGNKRDDISTVYLSLKELRGQFHSKDSGPFDELYVESFNQIFLPKNIFWDSDEIEVEESMNTIWKKSLNIGWSLITVTFNNSIDWQNTFWQQLETLRDEVKNNLFDEEKKVSVDTSCSLDTHDEAIYKILIKIAAKWNKKSDRDKEELDITATLPQKYKKNISYSVENELQDTAILSDVITKKSDVSENELEDLDIITETVVVPPQKADRDDPQIDFTNDTTKDIKVMPIHVQEELEQATVISNENEENSDVQSNEEGENESFSETVVVSPQEDDKDILCTNAGKQLEGVNKENSNHSKDNDASADEKDSSKNNDALAEDNDKKSGEMEFLVGLFDRICK